MFRRFFIVSLALLGLGTALLAQTVRGVGEVQSVSASADGSSVGASRNGFYRIDAKGNFASGQKVELEEFHDLFAAFSRLDGTTIVSTSINGLAPQISLAHVGSTVTQWAYAADTKVEVYAAAATRDGGVVLAGQANDDRSFVTKLQPNGAVAWSRSYDAPDRDRLHAIRELKNGGFIAVGYAHGSAVALRISAAGDVVWARNYSAPGGGMNAVVELSANRFAMVGQYRGALGSDRDAWIVVTDDKGEPLRQTALRGDYDDYLFSIATLPDGELLVGGATASYGGKPFHAFAARLSAALEVRWSRTFGPKRSSGAHDLRRTGVAVAHASGRPLLFVAPEMSNDTLLHDLTNAAACGAVSVEAQPYLPAATTRELTFETGQLPFRQSDVKVVKKVMPGVTTAALCTGSETTAATTSPANTVTATTPAKDSRVETFGADPAELLARRDFAALDAMAKTAAHELNSSTFWKLQFFYSLLGLGSPAAQRMGEQKYLTLLEQWAAESDSGKVAAAKGHTALAWRSRGTSTAVTDTGWKGFEKEVAFAVALLQNVKVRDHEWYREMVNLLGATSDDAAVDRIHAEGLAKYPTYTDLHQARAEFLLPKWGGDATTYAAFAERVTNSMGGAAGELQYALLVEKWIASEGADAVKRGLLSWERAKRGFNAAKQLFPDAIGIEHRRAISAFRVGDVETARSYFATSQWDDEARSIWRHRGEYDRFREQVLGSAGSTPASATPPVTAKPAPSLSNLTAKPAVTANFPPATMRSEVRLQDGKTITRLAFLVTDGTRVLAVSSYSPHPRDPSVAAPPHPTTPAEDVQLNMKSWMMKTATGGSLQATSVIAPPKSASNQPTGYTTFFGVVKVPKKFGAVPLKLAADVPADWDAKVFVLGCALNSWPCEQIVTPVRMTSRGHGEDKTTRQFTVSAHLDFTQYLGAPIVDQTGAAIGLIGMADPNSNSGWGPTAYCESIPYILSGGK